MMSLKPGLIAIGLTLTLLSSAASAQSASPGITDDTVTVGTIAPLSGPTAPLSIYNRQIDAYLKYVNEQGGVRMADGKTRKVVTRIVDSGGQPSRAVSGARELVDQDQVFAVLGPFGSNENRAIIDYLNAKKVPHVYLLSAASYFGDYKKNPWTIGFPPVPATQMTIFATYLKQTNPKAKVAILYGNDEYGKDGLEGFKRAIAGSDITIVASESYENTDATVDSQIVKLANSGADTFINFAVGRTAAQALQKASDIGWKPLRIVETSTASSGLLKRLPVPVIEGIVSAIYLKDPSAERFKNDPAIARYQTAMAKFFGAGFDPTAMPMGAALAEAFVKALEQMKKPQRAELMDVIRRVDKQENQFLLDGIRFNNASTDGFPINQMQIMTVKDGVLVPTGEILTGAPR